MGGGGMGAVLNQVPWPLLLHAYPSPLCTSLLAWPSGVPCMWHAGASEPCVQGQNGVAGMGGGGMGAVLNQVPWPLLLHAYPSPLCTSLLALSPEP